MIAPRKHDLPHLVVSHGEITLPVGIAGIRFGQVRRNRQILLVRVFRAGEIALRQQHIADPFVCDCQVAVPLRIVTVGFGEAGQDRQLRLVGRQCSG